jgi:hypothetical protein
MLKILLKSCLNIIAVSALNQYMKKRQRRQDKAWEVAGIVFAVPYNYSEVEEFYGNIFYIML